MKTAYQTSKNHFFFPLYIYIYIYFELLHLKMLLNVLMRAI